MTMPAIAFEDVLALVGLALLGVGLWWIYPPAASVVVGLVLLVLAWRLARARAARAAERET